MPLDPKPEAEDPARAAAAGDRAAFTRLVRAHKETLHRQILRYVRSEADAYDVLQETFVSAWRGIGGLDPERPVLAWLRAIALNRCHDHARRARVRQLFSFQAAPQDDAVDPNARPEAEAIARESAARVHAEIARLPPGLRDPLVLTSFEGLSQKEASEVLGLTVKAVELRLRRAREVMAERLGYDLVSGLAD